MASRTDDEDGCTTMIGIDGIDGAADAGRPHWERMIRDSRLTRAQVGAARDHRTGARAWRCTERWRRGAQRACTLHR